MRLTIFALLSLLLVVSCMEDHNNITNPENSSNKLSLYKTDGTQFVKSTAINVLTSTEETDVSPNGSGDWRDTFHPLVRSDQHSEGCTRYYFDPNAVTITQNDITLAINQGVKKHAEVYYLYVRDKYYHMEATLDMDIPARDFGDTQDVRAAFWTSNSQYSYKSGTANFGMGFEIYTANEADEIDEITITAAFSDGEDHVGDVGKITIPLSTFENDYNNVTYSIDWHPRYVEFKIGNVFTHKVEHGFSDPLYLFPHFSYYWLHCSNSPNQTYEMRISDVTFQRYNSNKSFNPTHELGNVNFEFNRYALDLAEIDVTVSGGRRTLVTDNTEVDGLGDDYRYYPNLSSFSLSDLANSCIPIVGKFDASGVNQYGYYNCAEAKFYIDLNGDGSIPSNEQFSYGSTGQDIGIVGDWDGDGVMTAGVFRRTTATYWLTNDEFGDPLTADERIEYGYGSDLPVVGDWDNDGEDDVANYRPSNSRFWTTVAVDANNVGIAYTHIDFGSYMNTYYPIAGDWNNDGTDNVGLFNLEEQRFDFTLTTSGSATTWQSLDCDDQGTFPLVIK